MIERLKKIQQLLKQNNIDAVIINNPVNCRYLSGFDGTSGVLLIGLDRAFLVTDFRYIEQATAQTQHFIVKRWQDDLYKSLVPLIEEAGWSKLGFESKHVTYATFIEMKEKLPAELIPLEDTVEQQRMIKSVNELAVLRRGAKLLDLAFTHIGSLIRPGMTEQETALELEIYLLRQGAEDSAFRFIVASGERGAMPHGTASAKKLVKGEMVTLDFGAVFEGYATDMTRTVVLGNASQRQLEIYDIVKEAQQKAAAAVKPGLKGSEVDAVARGVIDQAGYGQYFGHGLGHGVGLETHEQPTLNPRSNTVLEEGMVVTVEPGIYIPKWGGVRIEDMVSVTEDGVEMLTNSTRDLIVV